MLHFAGHSREIYGTCGGMYLDGRANGQIFTYPYSEMKRGELKDGCVVYIPAVGYFFRIHRVGVTKLFVAYDGTRYDGHTVNRTVLEYRVNDDGTYHFEPIGAYGFNIGEDRAHERAIILTL